MRDHTALARLLAQANFTLVRAANHEIWRCPCGHVQLTIAKTSGGGSGFTNAKLQIKRAVRECSQRRLKEAGKAA